ncbi:MMPL family transporter [Amycolatopsis sp. YIM 10]|uniref:MMPL family transporter n=1 Tax=Amycolatopsis sp. YIM 10 TaxID=2653857 RepID=UPI001D143F03|nr:MMPL family transporter [Amycolatopsis sp. YIM 10]
MVERIAGWSAAHRGKAIAGWFALVALTVAISFLATGPDAPNTDPGESGRAQTALRAETAEEPVREYVLVQAIAPADPDAALADLASSLRQREEVTAVRSPADPDAGNLISADGRSYLVTFQLSGPDERTPAQARAATETVDAVAARHPDVRVLQAGDRSLTRAVDEAIKNDLSQSHLLSLPITLLILIVVFGSLLAAGLPVLLTLSVVAATFALLGVIGKVVPFNSAGSALVLLIGVAVGVDYSLFVLRRHREERHAGRSTADALRVTARTSGRVVVFSGLTVVLCLMGLLFTGLGVFRGLTIGTALVVGLAMLGAVTVLPALLSLLGDRVDALSLPWFGRGRTAARESRAWASIATAVVRRPLAWGGLATLALLLTAAPALEMHLQDAAITQSLPREVPAVDAALRMGEAFPGMPTPARVVLWNQTGDLTPALGELRERVAASGGRLFEPVITTPVGDTTVVRVPLAGAGTDRQSNEALEYLRDEVLPATFDGKAEYAVGGRTATPYDFTQRITERSPYVFAFVLVLAFVLLGLAFRSIAIALVSIALNLLSIGAAYGVLTWVFQYGNLADLLGFTSYGGVVGWLPLFIFVLLFGLSMDYHIFILSRIRERFTPGHARSAIVSGIGASSGVVTSAAVIMIAVFAVFLTLTAIEYKMLGLGMAVAVFVDATVVRGVLLPATLSLLGDRAWANRANSPR